MSDNQKKIKDRLELGLGDRRTFEGLPESRVVGIDLYDMRNMKETSVGWNSFTLEALDQEACASEYKRWWIVNVPSVGVHFYTAAEKKADLSGFRLMEEFSGSVEILSSGDSSLSGGADIARGTLNTYVSDDGCLYAEEELEGCSPLFFFGHPYLID